MHRHDMDMQFEGDSLYSFYICTCGLTTTDPNEAMSWQGKTQPIASIRPMGVVDAERRYLEKQALFSLRYGTSGEALMKQLEHYEAKRTLRGSWWQRLVTWWRYDFAQTHHKGCGGVWMEAGTSGFAVLRVHFVCSKCYEESSISHSPGM